VSIERGLAVADLRFREKYELRVIGDVADAREPVLTPTVRAGQTSGAQARHGAGREGHRRS
jgi:hypothetical protein